MEPLPTPLPAQHPTASPTTAYLADGVGHLSLGLLLIDATRYNLSRPGGSAIAYAQALGATAPLLVPYVRQQLQKDIERVLTFEATGQQLFEQQKALGWHPSESTQPRRSLFFGNADVLLAWQELYKLLDTLNC